jgi:L-lactate dehydrogenase
MSPRYAASELIRFARQLLTPAGLDEEKATDIAEVLVEGDLLGHTTHGLALLGAYLDELQHDRMRKSGEPVVVADAPAAVTWDGQRLPGAWLTRRALALAANRAKAMGTCSVVIRRSHHIGCLAGYLLPYTERGLAVLITCSDPNTSTVAPHGGRTDVFTPNPIAAGWPTAGTPVIFDVSTSIATNGLTQRLRQEGGRFPGLWAVDSAGAPTDDPNALAGDAPGALLPIGGIDHGHKGYALSLLVEMLTGGLAGHGRADPREGWTSTTYVQVWDPARFGGLSNFQRQTERLAELCRSAAPRSGFDRVRLPGEAGLRRRELQLRDGVELYAGILPALEKRAREGGVPLPLPVAGAGEP